MFTGIIEATGVLRELQREGDNLHFWIESSLSDELKIDQSLAHNGVCLTVVGKQPGQHLVTAVAETLQKTTLGSWQPGKRINLERALRVGDRLDGHFVQGHVDATATCISREEAEGSWVFRFRFPRGFSPLIVEKGSVCLDGVSLTAFDVGADEFSVAIIPYTFAHTGFSEIVAGAPLNIEFDILGKYLLRKG
jgi:riboflavin synthase